MDQQQFNYLLSMQSQWRKQYEIQERIIKQEKQQLYKSKNYYGNSAEYQRHRNRTLHIDPSLQS
jgi:hypothetical protein